MEEFRSTDILDKEIASDARRKAERVLRLAEDTGKETMDNVKDRVNAARKEMEQGVKDRVAAFKKNADASVPLEKERFRVSFVQDAISHAFEAFVSGCGEDALLSFVVAAYKKEKNAAGKLPMTAVCVGMDAKTALAALQKAGANIVEPVEAAHFDELTSTGSVHRNAPSALDAGITLQSERTKATITLRKILSEIEDEKRLELTIALFGEKWGEICQA